MKKITKFVLPLVAVMTLAGCGGQGTSGGAGGQVDPPSFEGEGVSIHYNRKDSVYEGWALWLWPVGGDGSEYAFNGLDSYGAVASYPFSTWASSGVDVKADGMGFIVKSAGSWDKKDFDQDRFIHFDELKADDKGIYHVYLKQGDGAVYSNPEGEVLPKIESASFTDTKHATIMTNIEMNNVKVYEEDTMIVSKDIDNSKIARITLENEIDFTKNYKAEVTFGTGDKLETNILKTELYNSKEFKERYTYDGELGAIYSKSQTTFKVWSPFSKSIKLNVYESGTPKALAKHDRFATDDKYAEVDMVKEDKGVWSATVKGDLAGKYYTYTVDSSKYGVKEVIDPYAKSAGVNGIRGMIVDFDQTNPEGWDDVVVHPYDRKELTVWETHVADITSSKTWGGNPQNAKLFKGAYETGTTYTKDGVTVKTGFDHIKELGVNAVQFVPIFDQANDEIDMEFNWGYNPLNYNVLEGGYSSNPFDGYARIKEFKNLVKAYNEAGINIIMDVVYNHMAGADFSNFDVLVNDYYFRHDGYGKLSNGSGCGNETASELPMFRKFMLDSSAFLAKEYKLGGYRFDLMGLHDIETMNLLVANLKTINPDICVYGEPWTGGSSPLSAGKQAVKANGNSFQGYGLFSDDFRDALIAGGLKPHSELAWTSNTARSSESHANTIANGIKGFVGSLIYDPNKAVNYATCHDNFTLYDRYKAAGIKDDAEVKKMAMLANSIVFTSNGTTFMLAGEEMLRTKGGNSNSYNASYAVNELDYNLKVQHLDMFENYKKLIAFKQNVSDLHLDNIAEDPNSSYNRINVEISEKHNIISYEVIDETTNTTYKVFHRSGALADETVTLDLSAYKNVYLSTRDANKTVSATTELLPFETLIVSK